MIRSNGHVRGKKKHGVKELLRSTVPFPPFVYRVQISLNLIFLESGLLNNDSRVIPAEQWHDIIGTIVLKETAIYHSPLTSIFCVTSYSIFFFFFKRIKTNKLGDNFLSIVWWTYYVWLDSCREIYNKMNIFSLILETHSVITWEFFKIKQKRF